MRSIQAIPVVLTLLALGAEGCGAAGRRRRIATPPRPRPARRPSPGSPAARRPWAGRARPRRAAARSPVRPAGLGWPPTPAASRSPVAHPAAPITAYLNATPATRAETLSGWARFRLAHNAHEGDREVQLVATARDVRADAARASCVMDDYATSAAATARSPAWSCHRAPPRWSWARRRRARGPAGGRISSGRSPASPRAEP